MFLDSNTYYYTKQEVADIFRKTTKTIDVWVKQGKLHPDKFGTNKQSAVLFPAHEIQELLNKKGE